MDVIRIMVVIPRKFCQTLIIGKSLNIYGRKINEYNKSINENVLFSYENSEQDYTQYT